MDTYILRDGKQTGPYSDETIRRLVQQGSVMENDLAWRKGMPEWIPLHEVLPPEPDAAPEDRIPTPPAAKMEMPLAPAASLTASAKPAAAPTPSSAPATAATGMGAVSPSEPATPRQKAFLSYMGVTFPEAIGKEQAALLVNETMESTKDPARLTRWNEDRFRLYPDLYAAEIQARKENRANRFFDLSETEGADCFDGLSKAHCQVLVGYLDVKFPNWDAREAEATWNYFFPAIAEKFPDVVRREWRSKLKYPVGAKVAAELKGRSPSGGFHNRPNPSPIFALFKGLAIGAVAVAALGVGLFLLKHPSTSPVNPSPAATTPLAGKASAGTPSPVKSEAGTSPQSPEITGKEPASTDVPGTANADATPANPVPPLPGLPGSEAAVETPGVAAVPSSPATPATPAKTGSAPGALDPKPANGALAASEAAPATGSPQPANPAPSSLDALFGAPAAPQPAASSTGAPAAPRKTSLVLTKPVEVPLPFGQAKLPPGTQLKVVTQEGELVKVNYLNMVVQIPVSSTDLLEAAPK